MALSPGTTSPTASTSRIGGRWGIPSITDIRGLQYTFRFHYGPMSDSALAALLFLQLAIIIGFCRGVGALARRARQPQVVAEMVAGFLLGPSRFGWLAPATHAQLFPAASLHAIY